MNRSRFTLPLTLLLGLVLVAFALIALDAGRAAAVAPSPAATNSELGDQPAALSQAIHWLITTHQNDDGGFSSFSSGANQAPSDVGGTVDAMIAIAAAGYDIAAPHPEQTASPIAYLRGHGTAVADYVARGGGNGGKLLLALTAAGEDPTDFAGYNFAISLTQQLSPTGEYNAVTPFNQSLAILGVTAVNEPVPPAATQWLKDNQEQGGEFDGSWDDGFGTQGNTDATAMAMMALVAAGESPTSTELISATAFLSRTQTETGGWAYSPDPNFSENANSTAMALQALSALGEDFYSDNGPWSQNGSAPLTALLGHQDAGGGFLFFGGPNFFATVQSVPGVTGKPYPLPAPYEAARRAVACLETLQDPASGGWEQFAGVGVNAGGTSRAIEAIAAFGADPQSARWTTTPTGTNAVEALENLTPAYLGDGRGGRVGIVMQGVVAAGSPYAVTGFAGYNLPLSMTSYLSPTGEYANTGFGPSAHAEAMLGLLEAGYDPDPTAVSWLQNAEMSGSWGSPDSDGIALNVLGRLHIRSSAAISQLHESQQADAGWGSFGLPSSPSSTSEVVQGLIQQEENPFAPEWSRVVSGTVQTPLDAVLAQQLASGCWPAFGGADGPFATTDAIIMLTPERQMTLYLPMISHR
jgi:hypothetical protein